MRPNAQSPADRLITWKSRAAACSRKHSGTLNAVHNPAGGATFIAVYVGMALGRWPGLKVDRTGIAVLGAILLYSTGVVTNAAVLTFPLRWFSRISAHASRARRPVKRPKAVPLSRLSPHAFPLRLVKTNQRKGNIT